jgi:hypothetical protein
MGLIFEKEEEGLDGEPARARIFLKLAALGWGLHFLLWGSGNAPLQMVGIFFLLGAWVFSARAFFHLVTVVIVRLPRETQSMAQILVALIGAAIPLAYLIPHVTFFDGQILVQVFQPFIRSSLVWLPMSLFVVAVHATASRFPSFLTVRRYLILVAGVFLIAFIGGQGGLGTDEYDYLSSIARLDTGSIDEQMDMAASYLRLVILGYGTLLLLDLRQRALRNTYENQ